MATKTQVTGVVRLEILPHATGHTAFYMASQKSQVIAPLLPCGQSKSFGIHIFLS